VNNIVPTDSASVFAALNTLVLNSAALAIVRPDNPPPGIAGFVLDVVEDDGVELESDITDHFLEDNTAVQDQIALRPEVVTVTGQVAEVVRTIPRTKIEAPVPNPLPLIPEMLPVFTPGAEAQQQQAAEDAADLKASITDDQTLYGYYTSRLPQQPNQTKQSVVFGYLYQLWKGRQLFSVETPWGIFTNMAILSMGAKQPAVSKSVSEFSVTFKKIRVARSITVVPGLLAGRSVFQQAGISQNGTIGQLPLSSSQISQYIARTAPTSP